MKTISLCLASWLCLTATSGFAADEGTFTIVDGGVRALRDTKWYKVAQGARFQEGDVIEGAEKSQVQIELQQGAILNLVGASTLYAPSIPIRNNSLAGPIELTLSQGWMKLVASAKDAGVRVRTAVALIAVREAIIIVHAEQSSVETFVESGEMKLSELAPNGKEGPQHDAKAGEYWARSGDKPFVTERHAPQAYVAAMPRHFIDPLPNFSARYKGARVQLVVDHEVSYAEAAPWLQGPYRKTFLKRFQPRLQDREFRTAVDANISRYPEWDRILHPEKYLPKTPPPTPENAPTPVTPAQRLQ